MAKITIYSLTLVDMILFRYRYEHYLKKASKKMPRMPTTDVCTYKLMKMN